MMQESVPTFEVQLQHVQELDSLTQTEKARVDDQLKLRTNDHTDTGGIPPFLFWSNFFELQSRYVKQGPLVEIAHSFYQTGPHQHHKMKHHMKDREVTCDHNAPVFVNSVSAPLQQQMHLLLLWTTSMEYPSSTGCVEVQV